MKKVEKNTKGKKQQERTPAKSSFEELSDHQLKQVTGGRKAGGDPLGATGLAEQAGQQ